MPGAALREWLWLQADCTCSHVAGGPTSEAESLSWSAAPLARCSRLVGAHQAGISSACCSEVLQALVRLSTSSSFLQKGMLVQRCRGQLAGSFHTGCRPHPFTSPRRTSVAAIKECTLTAKSSCQVFSSRELVDGAVRRSKGVLPWQYA